MQLFVVKQDSLDDLHERAGTIDGPALYRGHGPVQLDAEWLLPSPLVVDGPAPKLIITSAKEPEKDDAANAIHLHRWLRPETERDARDNRLWTWLAHDPFADYLRGRWPIPALLPKASSSIRDHWILRGQGRGAVVRHGLARLWWAAHATHAPWQRWPELKAFQEEDEYLYTKLLLSKQNVNLQIRDRSYGSNPLILIPALAALRKFGDGGGSVDKGAAWLGRELNLVARYRSLDTLTADLVASLAKGLLALPGAPSSR